MDVGKRIILLLGTGDKILKIILPPAGSNGVELRLLLLAIRRAPELPLQVLDVPLEHLDLERLVVPQLLDGPRPQRRVELGAATRLLAAVELVPEERMRVVALALERCEPPAVLLGRALGLEPRLGELLLQRGDDAALLDELDVPELRQCLRLLRQPLLVLLEQGRLRLQQVVVVLELSLLLRDPGLARRQLGAAVMQRRHGLDHLLGRLEDLRRLLRLPALRLLQLARAPLELGIQPMHHLPVVDSLQQTLLVRHGELRLKALLPGLDGLDVLVGNVELGRDVLEAPVRRRERGLEALPLLLGGLGGLAVHVLQEGPVLRRGQVGLLQHLRVRSLSAAPPLLLVGALAVGVVAERGERGVLLAKVVDGLLEAALERGPVVLRLDEVLVHREDVVVLLLEAALVLAQLPEVLHERVLLVAHLGVQALPVGELVGEGRVLELQGLDALLVAGQAQLEDGLVFEVADILVVDLVFIFVFITVLILILVLGIFIVLVLVTLTVFAILILIIAVIVVILILIVSIKLRPRKVDLAPLLHHDSLLGASLPERVVLLPAPLGRRIADEPHDAVLVRHPLDLDPWLEQGPRADVDVVLGQVQEQVADDAVLVGVLALGECELALGISELALGLRELLVGFVQLLLGGAHQLGVFGSSSGGSGRVLGFATGLAQEPPQS
ncbi:hypothetical protein PG994_008410 [Apiospora phragmitis]|uniref:Uncharacterized protein n=1 Tax=Apiospora phragmitis TaxID=2905665 RepID=A0ABR1UW29_9PEZI